MLAVNDEESAAVGLMIEVLIVEVLLIRSVVNAGKRRISASGHLALRKGERVTPDVVALPVELESPDASELLLLVVTVVLLFPLLLVADSAVCVKPI